MSIIDDIKQKTGQAGLKIFKNQLKQMSPDQIIQILTMTSQETAKDVIKMFNAGIPVDEIKKRYMVED